MPRPASALSHLECPKCGTTLDADAIVQLCACGSPLLARYDLERARESMRGDASADRAAGMWRWRELLPVRSGANVVTFGESASPIVPLQSVGKAIGIERLAIKDESALPTGSFKARGAAVGVSRAKELGVTSFGMPTNGNAGTAWTAYGRRAGLEAHIAMPKAAPKSHRLECTLAGARVTLVDGLISDAGKLVAQWVAQRGLYDASTLKEPYRIEGKKTLGFEIAEQYGWKVPDVILYPTGGGVGLIGIEKALRELHAVGLIDDRLPRMVAVQSAGCAPIVRAFEQHAASSQAWEGARTVAFGINVPKAIGDFLVLEAIYSTGGSAVAVADDAIVAARDRLASTEGFLACLEGAATFAAAVMLREAGWIRSGEAVLLINTGLGVRSLL
jgi:threonine synthase